ncbi:cytochrome P450 [Nocardioides luteus]|uniref:Cytochrome n=1 Tax=Nocardioides luteus TaxID=1844 RepID=A0A1J4N458_9ACTN|nr:cytochrome P450 [Nocardioides luteus]OIJ26306.1 cytochrome [Nocardioides luteus]
MTHPTVPESSLYDPFDTVVQDNPYPAYARLRAEHPVYWTAASNTWVLSRHADVEAALLDPGTYSSASGIFPTPAGMEMTELFLPMMIMTDPPRHSQLRALVSKGFTARRIASMEPVVTAIATELVQGFVQAGACDLVAELAGPLPAMVIADLLGVPREDRAQFRQWSSLLVQADPVRDQASAGLAAAASLYDYFKGFIAQRHKEPRNDLISALVEAKVDGQRLTEEELLGFCLLLLVAGHETTTNLLANSAVILAQHPAARERLARHPELLPGAVEELLRFDSPVQGLSRALTRDVTIHGTTMPAGDTVLLLFGSANRDERIFWAADRFDIDREPEHHLAFGRGIHFCLGAALARLETRVALEVLLRTCPEWEVDEGRSRRLRSGPIRGYLALPMHWSPRC